MNARIVLAAVAIAMTSPAFAYDNPVEELARQSGLSERKVKMILGDRTAYAEYHYTYDRSLEQFKAAIGEANYQRLISGKPVVLPQAADIAVTDSETPVDAAL